MWLQQGLDCPKKRQKSINLNLSLGKNWGLFAQISDSCVDRKWYFGNTWKQTQSVRETNHEVNQSRKIKFNYTYFWTPTLKGKNRS